MNNSYSDITSRIRESPKWWDEPAVPRYCEFSPSQVANIYAREVALIEIACQNCDRRFLVAGSSGVLAQIKNTSLAGLIKTKEWHYGDPPDLQCCPAGPTMNSIPLKVHEFWISEDCQWKRCKELEVEITPDWAKENRHD